MRIKATDIPIAMGLKLSYEGFINGKGEFVTPCRKCAVFYCDGDCTPEAIEFAKLHSDSSDRQEID